MRRKASPQSLTPMCQPDAESVQILWRCSRQIGGDARLAEATAYHGA
jgi:hypothetical protein